jgi:hypothetical protein
MKEVRAVQRNLFLKNTQQGYNIVGLFSFAVWSFLPYTHQVPCREDADAREVLEIRFQFKIPRHEA